jgi:hypothetical protein
MIRPGRGPELAARGPGEAARSPRWQFPGQSVTMAPRAVTEGEAGRPLGGVRAAKDLRGVRPPAQFI